MAKQLSENEILALIAGMIKASGHGDGDMKSSTYDPDGNVATAGGIEAYITANARIENKALIFG